MIVQVEKKNQKSRHHKFGRIESTLSKTYPNFSSRKTKGELFRKFAIKFTFNKLGLPMIKSQKLLLNSARLLLHEVLNSLKLKRRSIL